MASGKKNKICFHRKLLYPVYVPKKGISTFILKVKQYFLNGVHGRVVLEVSVARESKADTEVALAVRPGTTVTEQYSLKIMFHVLINALRSHWLWQLVA